MWNYGSTSWNPWEPPATEEPRERAACERAHGGASGTRAVDRAADLVATVVRADEPLTFADLQDASGLAKSTTSRMLTALERSGLLERDARRVLRRRPPLLALRRAPRPVGRAGPAGPARPWRRIGEETGETVHLSVTRGDRVVQVAQVDSTYLLGTRDWTEVDVPAHCSALGKVFLAWGALALPEGTLERPTPPTLAERRGRCAVTAAGARERGWAVTADELEIGLTGIAVPVFGAARRRGRRPRHLRAHAPARGAARRARPPPAGARHRGSPALLRGGLAGPATAPRRRTRCRAPEEVVA